jgi:hypothetical protein
MLGFIWIVALICGVALYFLPSIIAHNKRKKNAASIFVINLFFGWSIVGWVIALAWAVARD